jgi:Ca2+-binding RTX toxin-like protein
MATIIGTAGSDSIRPSGESTGVSGGVPTAAAEAMTGNDSNDLLDGGAGANSILGGAGTDPILASGTNETLDGGTGTNSIRYTGAPISSCSSMAW